MNRYYTVIIYLEIFSMLIMQLFVSRSNSLGKERKKMFRFFFGLIAIATCCEWLGVFLQGLGSGTRILHIAVKFTELSIAPAISFMFALVLDQRYRRSILLFVLLHALLELVSCFNGYIFCVDMSSSYSHGLFYWLYILAYTVSILYSLFVVLRNIHRYQYTGAIVFVLIIFWLLAGISIQLYDSSLKVDYIVLSSASILCYVFTLEMIQQTDEMTELLNRRGYENYIAHLEQPCAVLFFDVDRFKEINDTFGHAAGDAILRSLGQCVRRTYSRYGKCFRYGGDEFCVILLDRLQEIEQLNHDFFMDIQKLREKEARTPSISIGYAWYDPKYNNIQDVVTEADQMMYEYKKKRREQEKML